MKGYKINLRLCLSLFRSFDSMSVLYIGYRRFFRLIAFNFMDRLKIIFRFILLTNKQLFVFSAEAFNCYLKRQCLDRMESLAYLGGYPRIHCDQT